jgi:hypothetical protein
MTLTEGDIRSLAVEEVDRLHRYTMEFSSCPEAHAVEYDEEELTITDHLRDHLTDGRFHDGCRYCHRRRLDGGTGLESNLSHPQRRVEARRAQ